MELPADVHADSRSRMPLIRREDLDALGKELIDASAHDPGSLAGLQGPAGIRLHDSTLAALSRPLNRYLRFEAGLDKRLAEIAILTTARELEQHFEWAAHDAQARKIGVPVATIDVIRERRPPDGLEPDAATMIQLVREAVGEHRVSSATYAGALAAFGKRSLLNYTALIGNYAATAVLLCVYDQQLPEGKTPVF